MLWVFLKVVEFGCLLRMLWENWISDPQPVPHWIPSTYCYKEIHIFVEAEEGVLPACLSEPPKVAQTSLMPQLMSLLPGWVFVSEVPCFLGCGLGHRAHCYGDYCKGADLAGLHKASQWLGLDYLGRIGLRAERKSLETFLPLWWRWCQWNQTEVLVPFFRNRVI